MRLRLLGTAGPVVGPDLSPPSPRIFDPAARCPPVRLSVYLLTAARTKFGTSAAAAAAARCRARMSRDPNSARRNLSAGRQAGAAH